MSNGAVIAPHTIYDQVDQFDTNQEQKSVRRVRKMVTLPKIHSTPSYPKLSDFVGSSNDDTKTRQNQLKSSDRSQMNSTYTMTNGSLTKELAAARARMKNEPGQFEYVLPGAIIDHRRAHSLDRYYSKPKTIRRGSNVILAKITCTNYRLVSEPITRPASRHIEGDAQESTKALNAASPGDRPWSDHRLPSIHQKNTVRAKNGFLTDDRTFGLNENGSANKNGTVSQSWPKSV